MSAEKDTMHRFCIRLKCIWLMRGEKRLRFAQLQRWAALGLA